MTSIFLIMKKYNRGEKKNVMEDQCWRDTCGGRPACHCVREGKLQVDPRRHEVPQAPRKRRTSPRTSPSLITHWWFWGPRDLSSIFLLLSLSLFPTHGYTKRFLFRRLNFSKFDHLKLHYCLSSTEGVWPLLDLRAAEESWDRSSARTWLEYHGGYQSGLHINFFLSLTVDASWLFYVHMNNDVWCDHKYNRQNHMTWRKSLPISEI